MNSEISAHRLVFIPKGSRTGHMLRLFLTAFLDTNTIRHKKTTNGNSGIQLFVSVGIFQSASSQLGFHS